MKRITRDERAGIITLAALAMVLIGGSFVWRQYSAHRASVDDSRNEVIAEIIAQDTVADEAAEAAGKGKPRKSKDKGRRKRFPAVAPREKRIPAVAPRNPLGDTIALKHQHR